MSNGLKKNKYVYCLEEYDSNNDFHLCYNDGKQKTWNVTEKENIDKFAPETIENYCRMDCDRLSSVYRQINQFVRCQIKTDVLEKEFKETFAQQKFLGDHKLCSLVMTLFSTGVGLFTFKIELENTSVKVLSQAMRKVNLYSIDDKVQEFISTYLGNILGKKSGQRHSAVRDDVFVFFSIRNMGATEKDISSFMENHVEQLYSINTGLDFQGSYMSQKKLQDFLNSNLSSRSDTFFSLNFRNAVIFESSWKHLNFTAKRLEENDMKERQIRSRQEYNDLNYLIWLECLLYQRHLLNVSHTKLEKYNNKNITREDASEILSIHEHMSFLINNLQGSRTTVYETYQEWMNYGRRKMGINDRYKMFIDRIERINQSIQTRYTHDQLQRQNTLGVFALLFCLIEIINIMVGIMKEKDILPMVTQHEIYIYPALFLLFVVVFFKSFIRIFIRR